ncbi:unnamed protein product [Boreogadus saida]
MLVTALHLFSLFFLGLAAVPVPVQPGDLTLQPGAAVTLTCSLASDMSSYTMLWYRQHVYGDPIEFIIKEYDTSRGRFKATLDTNQNRFSLGISELQVNDSGTFYCAAYHRDTPGCSRRTHTVAELRS